MKRTLLTIVIFLLSMQLVSAMELIEPFEISVNAIKDEIPAGGEAQFEILIKSNLNKDEVVQVSAGALDVFPFSNFARSIIVEPTLVNIEQNGETKFIVKIRSMDDATSNLNHITNVDVKSLTTEFDEKVQLNTFVIADGDLVQVFMRPPEVIIPGERNTMEVVLRNRGDVEFEDLEFYLKSEVWNENELLSFKPNEEITISYDIELAPGTRSGEYILSARLYKGQELKGDAKLDIRVGRNPDLKEKEEFEDGIFLNILTITNKNDGNVPVDSTFDYQVGFFERAFTSVSPEANYINGRYIWVFNVKPASDYEIVVTTDYRPGLIGLVVLAALFGVVVYFLSRGVKIKKRIFKIRNSDRGNEIKVMLHIKNKDNKEVHNVKIVDLIPNLIRPTGNYSTLMPDKVQQGSRGMRLVWTIETLAPGEERVISYNAASDMEMLGPIGIPPASVQYINRKAKFVISKSNSVSFRS